MDKRFTVVVRCRESLLRLPPGRGVRIAPIASAHGTYELLIQQREEKVPHIETSLPREPWVEFRGPAPTIEEAINTAAASSNEFLRQLAFAANAWQGLVEFHLAYESTEGLEQRQFIQNWIVDERGLPRVARSLDPDLSHRLLIAIARMGMADRRRMLRAIVQYTDALQHWKSGGEIYALAHLYMGVEAVTPLVIKREVRRRGLKDRKELEVLLNGPPAESLKLRFATWLYRRCGGNVVSRLDPWARRDLIFKGDLETYRAAQRASNQYEHGTAQHAEIQALAVKAIEKTAGYLRGAMLEVIDLSGHDRAALTSEAYAKPMRAGGFGRQLFGTINAPGEDLAAPDQLHPYVRWEFNLLDFRYGAAGAGEMRLNQKITPMFAPAASLTLQRIAFAGPTQTSHTNVEWSVTTGAKLPGELVTKAGAEIATDPPESAEWARLFGSFFLNVNALPPLARFWIAKLAPGLAEASASMTLSECINQIRQILESDARVSARLEEFMAWWSEALDAHEARSLLSTAYTAGSGLVMPLEPPNGKASSMSKAKELSDFVDHSVKLVRDLALGLDELLAARESQSSA